LIFYPFHTILKDNEREKKVELDFVDSKKRAEKSRLGRIPQFNHFRIFFFHFHIPNFTLESGRIVPRTSRNLEHRRLRRTALSEAYF